MKEGYVKLYRKIWDNPIISSDVEHLAIWIYLLTYATHTETREMFKGKEIILKPGQLITGRMIIAERLQIDNNKVQRILKKFEKQHLIEQQMSNKNRLVSIVSWNTYNNNRQQNEQQVNNNCTTSEQQNDTYKNNKNDNNIYLYFINKYKSNEKDFSKQIKIISEMKQDLKWNNLSFDEQLNLQSEIFY